MAWSVSNRDIDSLFQGSDRFHLCNLNRKNTLWIVAEDPAVEIEHIRDITQSIPKKQDSGYKRENVQHGRSVEIGLSLQIEY